MMEVLFIYEGQNIIIQCNLDDIMKDIINKFKNKIKKEDNNLCYLYNGDIINEELILNDIIGDKNEKKINIIVVNNNNKNIENNEKEIISNEIICHECKENILINIKDYKINLNECKNGHKKENILLNEYENMQKVDLTKIICNECKKNNIYNIYIIIIKNFIYVLTVELIYVYYAKVNMIKKIIKLLIIMIKIIYVKRIMINI